MITPNRVLSAALLLIAALLIIVALQPKETGLKALILGWVTLP